MSTSFVVDNSNIKNTDSNRKIKDSENKRKNPNTSDAGVLFSSATLLSSLGALFVLKNKIRKNN
ncbi:hypothetical protein ABGF49_04440 [Helcococcus ovis]|uniref:LPXTG cell wall anchor domain-containing protein n=1 Tax=Helcococcus ovis TaxID=72026 RepID=A0A4R9C2F3_9FIRM|nr:hypothetical protein [Helcococcus ovis]TFF64259.1 hypothetical protein EQF92_06285 [Helcococcus ovis]TFF64440.1 hypothetical protein EQF91_07790 [Helcococcus ovis]